MPYTLHDYQIAACNAAMQSIDSKRNDLIVIPTGGGKSVCMAGLVERILPSQKRVLIVSHVREILEQNADHIASHLPGIDFGIYCAGLKKFEPGKQVVIGSIHSLYRRSYGRGFDVVLIDEAHTVNRDFNSMYRQLLMFLAHAGIDGPRAVPRKIPTIGFSATPYRLDSGYLHQGDDALFSRIAYDVPIPPLIARGILAPLTTREVEEIDFSDLPIQAGEYQVQAFEERSNWLQETARSLAITRRLAANRKKWVVFACSIRHSISIAEMLIAEGISAIAVHHKLSKQDRDDAIRAFREGECRALINCQVLTTGFNSPNIDCIVLMRPTRSTGLYIQMIGRAMRTFPGKRDALILDFAGCMREHGAMTDIMPETMDKMIRDAEAARKEPSVKICPTCGTELPSLSRQCHDCGKLFINMTAAPSRADPIYPSFTVTETTCAIPGCNERARIGDLCHAHYEQERVAIEGETPRDARLAKGNAITARYSYVELHRPDDSYVYRRKVPITLRAKAGRDLWYFSLKTKDETEARAMAKRITAKLDQYIQSAIKPAEPPPPSAFPLLSTEEVATLIGITRAYAKQMRHYGTGPRFYSGGGSTQLGWRQVVYRQEDVSEWRERRTYIQGKDGRTWRLAPEAFVGKPSTPR